MRLHLSFDIGRWVAGVFVTGKFPLAGYIDGVEYRAAVENRIVMLVIGPFGVGACIGPEPKKLPPADFRGIKFGEDQNPMRFEAGGDT